jgi:hypothetical protein
MKMKENESLVKSVVELHDSMASLTVDSISETPVIEPEIQTKICYKTLAKENNCVYIEPKKRLPALGKLPEKQKIEHENAWKYVKGIYENYIVNGEPLSFWYTEYPGDQDCLWEIPANVPVYVPRFIAKHLEECQKYHTFGYNEKNSGHQRVDDFQFNFSATGTHYRGKFRAIGAFA